MTSNNNNKRKIEDSDLEQIQQCSRKKRGLQSRINIDHLIETLRILLHEDPKKSYTSEDVLEIMTEIVGELDKMSFSELSKNDEWRIPALCTNYLDLSKIETKPISKELSTFLNKAKRVWSLTTEAANRTLIDLHLLEALEDEDTRAVFPEYKVPEIKISDKLTVWGLVDYLISKADTSVDRQRKLVNGYLPSPSDLKNFPVTVVEAKKEETLIGGQAQLLAQMSALGKLNKTCPRILGILTDGIRWTFYIMKNNELEYLCTENPVTDPALIQALLRHFVKGNVPPELENFVK